MHDQSLNGFAQGHISLDSPVLLKKSMILMKFQGGIHWPVGLDIRNFLYSLYLSNIIA